MRNKSGKFARGGAIASSVALGLCAANAFAADGTLKLEQGIVPTPTSAFNGNVGGGEFGVYDFVNNSALTLMPMSATAKVNSIVNGHGPFDFQTFCLEAHDGVQFNTTLDWTANVFVELDDGSHRNLSPKTAYLFFKFWTANAFSPAYNYTLGPGRSGSAATLQLALWFTEGESGFNSGDVASYTADAEDATGATGSWTVLWGNSFPGNLGGVRALNLNSGASHEQDVLAIFGEAPPPPPDGNCSGLTPGFWHNKNGCKAVKESGGGAEWSWLTTINGLPLVDGTKDGHYLADVPLSKTGFNTISDFLVSGNNAKNMAQKLSQHVCAMQFNMLYGLADEDCLVYTGQNADCVGGAETVSIGEVMALAIASLASDPYTPDGHAQRHYQECLKNILDAANNNTNWVN